MLAKTIVKTSLTCNCLGENYSSSHFLRYSHATQAIIVHLQNPFSDFESHYYDRS